MPNQLDTKNVEDSCTIHEKDELESEEFYYKLWEDDRL